MNRRTKRAVMRELEDNAGLLFITTMLVIVAVLVLIWSMPK